MIARGAAPSNRPGTAAGMVGSLLLHAAVAGLLLTTVRPIPKPGPPAYAVDLVAAPKPAPKQRLAREAVPTPPVEKPAPVKPQPKPKPAKTPPAPAPKPRPAEPVRREAPPPTQAPVAPAEGEAPSTGTDAATINTPGLVFPFPEYLHNIVNQVYRRWDRSAATRRLSAEISFTILADGGVRDIRVVSGSGNFDFDLNAQGAIEAAGTTKAFGPLPKGWHDEILQASIVFKPQ